MQRKFVVRRLSALAGLIGVLSASLSGCGGGGGSPQTRNPGHARWTVLVYMNAANDLQPYSFENVAQMASVGSDANVNIVLQWKQSDCASAGVPCGLPSYVGTRRYLLKPHSVADVSAIKGTTDAEGIVHGNTASLDADRLPDPASNGANGTSDMGDYRTLSEFIQWGSKNYPADHLAVVVWDHGSGWRDLPGYSRAKRTQSSARQSRALSFDEDTQHAIDTWQLSQGLTGAAQPIDVLAIDCSLEQMLEVAFEVRQSAGVIVGSEDSPPGDGYPYDKWLAELKTSGKDGPDVGRSLVNTFLARYVNDAFYDQQLNNVTQSLLDASKLDNVAAKLDVLGRVLRGHVSDEADLIAYARTHAQFYEQQGNQDVAALGYQDIKDLYDYARLLATGGQGIAAPSTDIQQAAGDVMASLTGTNGAILLNGHGNFKQNGSNGLAIYVPAAKDYRSTYTNLALAKAAPNWVAFLTSQSK